MLSAHRSEAGETEARRGTLVSRALNMAVGQGRSKREAEAYSRQYVEGLSEARTKPEAMFSAQSRTVEGPENAQQYQMLIRRQAQHTRLDLPTPEESPARPGRFVPSMFKPQRRVGPLVGNSIFDR